MPLTPRDAWDGGRAGRRKPPTPKPPKRPRHHKGAGSGHGKHRTHAGTAAHHAAAASHTWHEQSTSPAGNDARLGPAPRAGHLAGAGLASLQLATAANGSGFAPLPALAGTLLDLVGEGRIGLHVALASWQAEQTRITNRTWRRPGGLARMGSL